jgi:hypothetical protein
MFVKPYSFFDVISYKSQQPMLVKDWMIMSA